MKSKNTPFVPFTLMVIAVVNLLCFERWLHANRRTSELIGMVEKAQAQTTAALDVADRWEMAYRLCAGKPVTPAEPPSNVSLVAR